MRINNISLVIGAATLALIALVFFQVKWMMQSRDLIEEQFNNKVNMALCAAVQSVASAEECAQLKKSCSPINPGTPACSSQLTAFLNTDGLENSIDRALSFYQIDLDYQLDIVTKNNLTEGDSPYCCSLSPILETDDHLLSISFPNKVQYILDKLGFMMVASILILIFISLVFAFASYYLLRQKRISELNVDFFNNMTHELRTPLTNINLATRLLVKQNESLKQNKFIQVLHRENDKMKVQVERVLEFAKLEKGESQLCLETVNLNELLQKVIHSMELQVKDKGGQINLHTLNNTIIEADPLHLGNAFRNLIDNSLKYTQKPPQIDITLEELNQKEVVIHFQDNGIGIGKANQPIIFQKFQRVSTGNVHTQKGFGLGLSYVKKIVELHTGFIQIFSELNKGTRFDLVLPKAK